MSLEGSADQRGRCDRNQLFCMGRYLCAGSEYYNNCPLVYGRQCRGTQSGDRRLYIRNKMFCHDVGAFVAGIMFNTSRALTSTGGVYVKMCHREINKREGVSCWIQGNSS